MTLSAKKPVPGMVLPAGTYTFRLFDSTSDRHIVQIFNRKGTQLFCADLVGRSSALDHAQARGVRERLARVRRGDV